MACINSKQFRKEIEKKFNDHIVLFLGQEEGEKEKAIIQICSIIFPDSSEQKNSISRFRVENDEFLKAVDFALSSSIFSNNKVCIIYNIDQLTSTKNNIILFNDLINNTPDSTTIIMTAQHNSPPSFIKNDLLQAIRPVQFWKYFDSDIYSYISMTFKNKGFTIDRDAMLALVEQTGNDIKKIDDAIDTIINYADEKNITKNLIKTLVPSLKDISIFDFIDSLFMKQKTTLGKLNILLDHGTPDLLVLNMILKQIETIEKYSILTQAGINSEDAIKQCGIYTKKVNSFKQYLKNFPGSTIRHIIAKIAHTDRQLKSGRPLKGFISNPLVDLITFMLLSHQG